MPKYDLVIKGGRIVEIGGNIPSCDAAKVIDARGLVVAHGVVDLQVTHVQNPGMFHKNPVDQFHENCWVAPFVEDDVSKIMVENARALTYA